jgi:hypothetical protein
VTCLYIPRPTGCMRPGRRSDEEGSAERIDSESRLNRDSRAVRWGREKGHVAEEPGRCAQVVHDALGCSSRLAFSLDHPISQPRHTDTHTRDHFRSTRPYHSSASTAGAADAPTSFLHVSFACFGAASSDKTAS